MPSDRSFPAYSDGPRRRDILVGTTAMLLSSALGGCGGNGSGGSGDNGVSVVSSSPPPLSSSVTQPSVAPSSGPRRLALWGDSRTQGQGSTSAQSFSSFLAAYLSSITVVNQGIAGQTTAQIMARQNSVPALLTIEGNRLPPSGSVAVLAASANIFYYPHSAPPTAYGGTLLGIPGVYSSPRTDGTGTFTRNAPGDAAVLDGPTPFLTNVGESLRDADIFLCCGENEVGYLPAAQIAAPTAMVASRQAPANGRYIVAGVVPDLDVGASAERRTRWDALNDLLRSIHGDHYLDLPLPPRDAELAELGYTPSSGDRADIAGGGYPRGMFADNNHFNAFGQKLWAIRVRDHYRARGWI